MTGASFDDVLNADSLQVGGGLYMRSGRQELRPASRHVNPATTRQIRGRALSWTASSFDGALDADSVQVGGSSSCDPRAGGNKASFKVVILSGSKITGQVSIDGASFEGVLDADRPSSRPRPVHADRTDKNLASFKVCRFSTTASSSRARSSWTARSSAGEGRRAGPSRQQAMSHMRNIATDAAVDHALRPTRRTIWTLSGAESGRLSTCAARPLPGRCGSATRLR